MDDLVGVNELGLALHQGFNFWKLLGFDQISCKYCMWHASHQRAITLAGNVECPGSLDTIFCSAPLIVQSLNGCLSGLTNIEGIRSVPLRVIFGDYIEVKLLGLIFRHILVGVNVAEH